MGSFLFFFEEFEVLLFKELVLELVALFEVFELFVFELLGVFEVVEAFEELFFEVFLAIHINLPSIQNKSNFTPLLLCVEVYLNLKVKLSEY